MATLRQVAETAKVSTATASRVLGRTKSQFPVSPATRQRVHEAAERLGYRVNYHMQAVATGRANAIGFTAESILNPRDGSGDGNLYFDTLRRGLEYTTQEAGSALVSIRPGKGRSALQRGADFLLERRLDALVVPGSNVVVKSVGVFEANPGLPVIMVNPMTGVRRPQVRFNSPAGMQLIVDHLKMLGHREVLWFGPDAGLGAGPPVRRQLLVETAWKAGIRGSICTAERDAQDATNERAQRLGEGSAALQRAIAAPDRRWTAIVAYNDYWAITACAALAASNLHVPRDVSVIGFDNLIAEFCVPALTTVDHHFYEMGRRAGELTAQLVEMDERQRIEFLDHEETVEPSLVVRESTGPAPQP